MTHDKKLLHDSKMHTDHSKAEGCAHHSSHSAVLKTDSPLISSCCATASATKKSGNPSDIASTKNHSTSQIPYTCPMHPEVEQLGPGLCPKCGMALEPRIATAEEDTSELEAMRKRFWVSLILLIPLLCLAMAELIPGLNLHHRLSLPIFNSLQAVFATPIVLWGGWPFFSRAWTSFKTWNLNMFSLIGLGTGAAYAFSMYAVLFPNTLPESFKTHGMIPLYFEAAAVIITLVLLGQILELRARAQSNSAIKSLLQLTPNVAIRINADGVEEVISLHQIQREDILRIKPGAKIPIDGVVLEGETYIDETMITGESIPTNKKNNDHVIAGTINQTGSLLVQAKKIGSETLLSQIIQLVNEASWSRAPIQKLVDSVSAWFVPFVILVAVMAFTIWAWIGPDPALANAFVVAVSVFIIACPCALGLATPISVMVGIGRGAKEGILIKNAEALELMEKIDVLIVDKTGTLTEGKPKVQQVIAHQGFTESQILGYAAALESLSEHPLAQAITQHAQKQNIALKKVQYFESITGKGITGTVDNKKIAIGNSRFMQELKINIQPMMNTFDQFSNLGHTIIFVSVDVQLVGIITIADSIKESTPEAIQQLQKQGIRIVLLTGDNTTTASVVAQQLNIKEFKADVLPADKFNYIQELQKQGHTVAMAGDGVNDAPALAKADVGLAMGTGTDIAMNSADIVLVKGDLRGIVKAQRLSTLTMKNIRQNLFFAFIYNFLGVPVAAGLLYPWFGILLNPMFASAAMSVSSICVILNALRLKRAS